MYAAAGEKSVRELPAPPPRRRPIHSASHSLIYVLIIRYFANELHHRDLAVSLTVFSMRLELARARELEGQRVCPEEEGPGALEHVYAFARGWRPDSGLARSILAAGKADVGLIRQ
jgi:hypothetical protein